MKDNMILPGVNVRMGAIPGFSVLPSCSTEKWQANQKEFLLRADGVGAFYVRNGNEVIYSVEEGADPDWVNLYLNGQVMVALLHQRKIISFHASSFIYDGRGVMILGETGAGKSSLTVSFVLDGAGFLTDDLSAVIFRDGRPQIRPFYREVKLRRDTVFQLGVDQEKLREAEHGTGKHYLRLNNAGVEDFPLDAILKIETGDCAMPELHKLTSAEKFALLRSEVCSWEFLAGMAETEAAYLQQLVQIVEQVNFVRVVRPAEISIMELHAAVKDFLKQI